MKALKGFVIALIVLLVSGAVIYACTQSVEDCQESPCEVIEASPTPSLTPTPTPEDNCVVSLDSEFQVCEVTPTATPSATPLPTDIPVKEFALGGAPQCTDNIEQFRPTVTKAWRDGKGGVDIEWTSGNTNEYLLYYGPTGKEYLWNTGRITGLKATVHLFPDQMIDVSACSVSPCGNLMCSARFIDP